VAVRFRREGLLRTLVFPDFKLRQYRGSFLDLFVDVAPEPALVGLGGGDDGVAGALEVLGRVAIFGGVAAAYVAALEAGAEVDPGVAEGDALLADMDGGCDVFGVLEVLAEHRHRWFPRRLQVEKTRLRRLVSG
jgi:hypothetical protein